MVFIYYISNPIKKTEFDKFKPFRKMVIDNKMLWQDNLVKNYGSSVSKFNIGKL
jgi:hypothetical protein